jgi:hypothetical protein
MLQSVSKHFGPVSLESLQAGDTFYRDEGGKLSLGIIAGVSAGSPEIVILMLTGADAFKFFKYRKINSPRVLATGIPSDSLKMRLDVDSAVDAKRHVPGQITISREPAGPVISGAWPEHADATTQYNQNGIAMEGWEYSAGNGAAHAFSGWALSYVDESGAWVDLLRVAPPHKA